MSRAVRVEYPGARYHVMARGVARMPTFLDDVDRLAFLKGLGEIVERGALIVHAFCLMPNHYHLLVSTPGGALARWMRHVNGDYVRRFNVRHRRVGHLWQGRYKAILVGEANYFQECSRYIHLNPNRAKLTRPAEQYRWSSYRNYVGGPGAVPWVETATVLADFGGDPQEYRRYVESGKGEKSISPFERAVAGLILGSETFVASVRKRLRKTPDTGAQPALRALCRGDKADPEAVERAVEDCFADVGCARRGRLLLFAQRQWSPLRPAEIARRYGRGPSAVSMAQREITAEAEASPRFRARLAALAARLLGESEK